MKTHFTPLKAWSWTGSIFIIVQICVIIFFKVKEDDINKTMGEDYSSQINYMHREFKKENSSYKAIIIGSSLIGHGVASSDEITNYLSSQKKANVKFLKIWDSGDPLRRFMGLNLINEIIKAKPNLVLFQTELAAIKFDKKEDNMIQKLSFINKRVISHIFFPKDKITYNLKNRGYPKKLDKQIKWDTLKHIPAKRNIKNIDELGFAIEGLRLLQKEGIKTVLVDIPRPLQAEKIIYIKSFKKKLQKLFNMYNKNLGIEHWNYTGTPIYYKHCIDQAHFNKEGRSLYTKWLLDKIEEEK